MSDWEGIAEDAADKTGRKGTCTVGAFLDGLSPEGKKNVAGAIARTELSASGIIAALRQRGARDLPTVWTMQRHRRGDCVCFREAI